MLNNITYFVVEFMEPSDKLCDVCVKHGMAPGGFNPNKAKYQALRRAESGDDAEYTRGCADHLDYLLSYWDEYGIGERRSSHE